jgi:ribosomal protein S18 acetylase RimI-like enzyme
MDEIKTGRYRLQHLSSRATLTLSTNRYLDRVLSLGLPFLTWIALVASNGDEILGFAFVRFTKKREGSLGTFVVEQWQGRGLGKILMKELLRRALSRRMRRIYLTVLETNSRARALYESFGFRYTRRSLTRTRDGSYENVVEMELNRETHISPLQVFEKARDTYHIVVTDCVL